MIRNNLAYALYEFAASQPAALALAVPAKPGRALPKTGPIAYQNISFQSLAFETNCIARGLLAYGFKPGDRVVLLVPPGFAFFSLCFAFLQAGIVPVLIDPGIGINYLKQCINESAPVGFVGIAKAHAARVLFGWGRKTVKKNITVGKILFCGGDRLRKIREVGHSVAPPVCFDAQSNDLAAILFTSGSTGVPKGVMYSHGNFRQQVEIIRNTFDVRPGDIDLPSFPPFALFNPCVGVSTVLPDMDPTRPADVDPERIIRIVQQFNVTSMFGSPALIDKVGRYGEARKIKLPTLKRVISAGAPVPAKSLRRFASLLNSSTQVFTPYGATEAMPVSSIGSHQLLGVEMQQHTESGGGICIGKPVEAIEVQVIKITDEPIEFWSDDLKVGDGEIGEIVVKGKNVTSAYFMKSMANALAKIRHGDDFWHRMGDVGYFDAEGNLWFCGRKSHRVKLTDKVLYSVQCESVFNKHLHVHRTALVGVGHKAVLCVEVGNDVSNRNREKLRKELLKWAAGNALTKDIQTVLFHPAFPVDTRHNAKICREKLAAWAAAKLSGGIRR
ncbi:MAG TPA: fatty acid CoA ligase family protein [Flavisolibacter sp.]|nr:fatty acid CoA ligase family protein [Flavisolibacter sp.]